MYWAYSIVKGLNDSTAKEESGQRDPRDFRLYRGIRTSKEGGDLGLEGERAGAEPKPSLVTPCGTHPDYLVARL